MSEQGCRHRAVLALVPVLAASGATCADAGDAGRYGLGHAAAPARVAAQDIAIAPDGAALPPGRGEARTGAAVYAARCAACHGACGREGPDPVLVGGQGTLASDAPLQTIGSYWPYATTVFDYVRRAMPFTAPGSLTADEVYAVTAFLLHANGIIGADSVLDRETLPAIVMPNRDGFVPDPRPDLP